MSRTPRACPSPCSAATAATHPRLLPPHPGTTGWDRGCAYRTQTPKCVCVPAAAPHEDGILAWEPVGPGGCRVGLPGSRCCRGALIAAGSRRARGFVPRSRGRRVAPLMGKLMSRGARGRWWQPGPRLCRQLPPARGGSQTPLPFGHPTGPSPASVSPTSLVWGGPQAPAGSAQLGFP